MSTIHVNIDKLPIKGPCQRYDFNNKAASITMKGSHFLALGRALYHVNLRPSLDPPFFGAADLDPVILILGIGIDDLH